MQEVASTIEINNVEFAVFMPTPNNGRNAEHELGARQRLELKKNAAKRVRLFSGSNYITYWLHQNCNGEATSYGLADVLTRISADLESGDYVGIGEIALLHFEKRPGQHVIKYQPNFAPYLEIVAAIAKQGAWLDLHIEPVDPNGLSYESWAFGGLELIFKQNPELKVILSHTAMTNSTNARRILERYPNVMMNIRVAKPWRFKNLEPVVNTEGEVYQDWARLFEEMPNRFIVGTDTKFMRGDFILSEYKKEVDQIRNMLGSLSPEAAKLIAYENAKKIFP